MRDAFPEAAAEPPLRRTAIVGLGSPQGDDRAGWLALQALDAMLAPDERRALGVTTLALDRPGVLLLEHLRGVECAVLIDAMASGAAPGTVALLRRRDLSRCAFGASTHGVGVAEALALGAALGRLPREFALIGIEAGSFAAAAGAPAARAAERVAAALARWLRAGAHMAALPERLCGAAGVTALPLTPCESAAAASCNAPPRASRPNRASPP